MTTTAVRPEDCLSQHEGDVTVEGPDGPIRIVRDRWGIPHVKAGSARDAFFAQGYCLGQDRLWQLELYRHFAWGRAAEILGKGLLRRDQQNRRLNIGRYAEREWEAQTDTASMILEAYAAGVNAAIEANPAPYEFHVLPGDGPHTRCSPGAPSTRSPSSRWSPRAPSGPAASPTRRSRRSSAPRPSPR